MWFDRMSVGCKWILTRKLAHVFGQLSDTWYFSLSLSSSSLSFYVFLTNESALLTSNLAPKVLDYTLDYCKINDHVVNSLSAPAHVGFSQAKQKLFNLCQKKGGLKSCKKLFVNARHFVGFLWENEMQQLVFFKHGWWPWMETHGLGSRGRNTTLLVTTLSIIMQESHFHLAW